VGLLPAWKNRKSLLTFFHTAEAPSESMKRVPLFLIWTGSILGLVIAFSPATYYDTLVYHYALPHAYLQAGHWIGLRELIYSSFPQIVEMIWLLGMLLAGEVLANLLGWLIAALGVLAVYRFALRYFGRETATWAAAFLCVMPTYLLLSSGGYVDVGLAIFGFCSFYALCLWKEHQKPALAVLAGILAGFAIGTKYTGAIPFVIGALYLIKEAPSRNIQNIIKLELLYALSAFFVVIPWLAKNLHFVGNPLFPFFYSFHSNPQNPWVQGAAAGYFRGLTEYAPRTGLGLFKLLWDIAVHGLDFGGGMDVLGDLGWAPLFVFLPALWLIKKKPHILSLVLLYALLFFIPWGMTRPVLRFLVPLVPFLALGAAYGYTQGISRQALPLRNTGRLLLLFLCLSNARVFFEFSSILSMFHVPLGFVSRARYLSEKLDYYDAASFVNTLPPDSLTYVVGDQRGYYYNRPVLVTPVFNMNPLTAWANESASGQDLSSRLKARGITHLLVNNTEFMRLDSAYHLFPFTPQGQANWNALREHVAKPLYHDVHCDVLAL